MWLIVVVCTLTSLEEVRQCSTQAVQWEGDAGWGREGIYVSCNPTAFMRGMAAVHRRRRRRRRRFECIPVNFRSNPITGAGLE